MAVALSLIWAMGVGGICGMHDAKHNRVDAAHAARAMLIAMVGGIAIRWVVG